MLRVARGSSGAFMLVFRIGSDIDATSSVPGDLYVVAT